MNITICISSYGDNHWKELAQTRALPSATNQDTEIVTVHQPEGTIASCRNRAAEKASGDWLCFLDADDELAPGFTWAMRKTWQDTIKRGGGQTPALLTPAVQRIDKGRERPPRFYPEGPLEKNNWLVIGTLVPTSLFHQVGGFPDYPHGFEDWALWAKCHLAGATIIKVKRAIYIQHINLESKHRVGWRDRKWQVEMHNKVAKELFG